MILQREKLPSKLKQVVTFMQTDKKSAKRDFVCSSAPKANSLKKKKLSKVKTSEHGKQKTFKIFILILLTKELGFGILQ